MKKKKYLKWWIAAVSAVFIVGAGIFVYTQYKAAQTSGDVATKDGTSASASDITWNGKTYSYNEHLSNFLFLGIDTKEKAETKTGQADAGQADAYVIIKLKEKVREKRKIYAYDICTLQIWKRSDQRASEAASQHS